MPKISVEDKVLVILKSNDWVGSDEIEKIFPAGEPGHFSWPQRLRGLREPQNGGYTIEHRIKVGTKNLSEWHLVLPNGCLHKSEAIDLGGFIGEKLAIGPEVGAQPIPTFFTREQGQLSIF